ncbi:MAG: hypothetical protein KJ047_01680 [Anaerolineae bacterium]|nr:hypothetical protein [Anaerolineae bacterium]
MSELHSPLSERDLELLSAYLDGELAAPDQGVLEERLAREGDLRSALDDLRASRQLLCSLPLLKAPRSFALDPAVYGRRIAWWQRVPALANAFQLAGALGAAASLVLVVAGLLIAGTSGDRTAAPLAPAESPALEIALQPTTETLATSAPMPTTSPQVLRTGTPLIPATAPAATPTSTASPPSESAPEAAAQFAAPEMDEEAVMLGAEAPADAAALSPASEADGFATGIMAAAPESAAGGAAGEAQLRDSVPAPSPSPTPQEPAPEPTPTRGPAQASETAAPDTALPASGAEAESPTAAKRVAERAPSSEDGQTGTALALAGLVALIASAVLYLTGRRRARRP